MFESESLSMISVPDPYFSLPEAIPLHLTCWEDMCLSEIWIPSCLLKSRKKPASTWETEGIFHTLRKRDHAKQIESFSVYIDSDNESEADIYQSDSDDAFNLDSISSEQLNVKDDSEKFTNRTTENCSQLKSFSRGSNISLNEILNSIKEVDITNFDFKNTHKHKQEETLQSTKKTKNVKKKEKAIASKSIALEKFLEDYTEEDRQEDYANDYLRKVKLANKTGISEGEICLKNINEFPNLVANDIEFMHGEKMAFEPSELSIKSVADILNQQDENEIITSTNVETTEPAPEIVVGKFVIENIPLDVCEDDLLSLLHGYGGIQCISLEPDGDYLKASVEIDLLSCDIDWIIDCLNGTEPFGASPKVLKCYTL